jgi:hypothetical protein
LGRPVAILRLGARLPDETRGIDANFLFGCPPFVIYPPRPNAMPVPPGGAAPEELPAPKAGNGGEPAPESPPKQAGRGPTITQSTQWKRP